MSRRATLFLAFAAYAAWLAAYFWEEGPHWFPDPRHWWWYASVAALSGFNFGQRYENWRERELQAQLAAIFRDGFAPKDSPPNSEGTSRP